MSFRGVAQKSVGHFLGNESWLHIESTSKFFGYEPYAQRVRSSEIQNQRRRLAMRERTQANGIRIPLPNDIYESHSKVNGPPLKNRRADVEQHAVTKINRIIQTKNSNCGAPLARPVLKHAFSTESGLRIFTLRCYWRGLDGSAFHRMAQRINIAGGKRNDSRGAISFRHQPG